MTAETRGSRWPIWLTATPPAEWPARPIRVGSSSARRGLASESRKSSAAVVSPKNAADPVFWSVGTWKVNTMYPASASGSTPHQYISWLALPPCATTTAGYGGGGRSPGGREKGAAGGRAPGGGEGALLVGERLPAGFGGPPEGAPPGAGGVGGLGGGENRVGG